MPNKIITQREVLGMFFERLQQNLGASYIDPISTPIISSDQDSESYPWLGQVPQLTEKKGTKQFGQLGTEQFTIKNVEYQGGITLQKKDILYDKTGQVVIRVNELADRAQAHWTSLVAPLIVNGEGAVCYDGQFFFDTDHVEGDSGTQSNDVSADISTYPLATHGTTAQPSSGEMVFAIMASIQAMLGLKDDQGELVNEEMNEFLVLTGLPLMTPAMSALRKKSIDGGDDNILIEQDSFRIRLQSSARFSAWTSKFATFATQGQQKPIIRQQRNPNNSGDSFDVDGMEMSMLWLDSEHCKLNDECLVSIETERAAGYGDWKKAVLTTLT